MRRLKDAYIREYALEMLVELNDRPHMNKEKLFSDSMAFYRWRLSEKEADGSLAYYMHEFGKHHGHLVNSLDVPVQCACFITWFVEHGFHKLPPLTGFDPTDEYMQKTRFSSPSFRLPTGNAAETYVIQWVLWSLAHPLSSLAKLLESDVERWADGLLKTQSPPNEQERARLRDNARHFFTWGRTEVRAWSDFSALMQDFLRECPDMACVAAYPAWDTAFVNWFAGYKDVFVFWRTRKNTLQAEQKEQ